MKRKKKTKTVIFAVLFGLVALIAGAALGVLKTLHTSGDELKDAITNDDLKAEEACRRFISEHGCFNMLLLGEDNVDGSSRSDTILFMKVDIDGKNVRAISLPRDTRVRIPGHGTQKLNHAFAFGGVELLKKTVEDYMGEPILYYVMVDYDSFPAFIDMLGGVEVDVQKRMRYVDKAGHLDINIQPGVQLLDGKTALHFVRFRKDALGDIGRIQRQQQFLKSMLKKMYDPTVYVKIPELIDQAMKIFKTDMPLDITAKLAGYIQHEIGRERIFFSMLPGEPTMIDRLSYWQGDTKAAKAFLNASTDILVSGDLQTKNKNVDFSTAKEVIVKTDGAGRKIESHKEMTQDEIREFVRSFPTGVAVLNGTGKAGVSNEISSRLYKLGVEVKHSGNAKHFDYQHNNVVYPTNADANVKKTAVLLGQLLGIPKNLVRVSKQAEYASIIAGHDYDIIIKTLDELLKISGSDQ